MFTKEVDLKVNFGKLRRGSREETAGAKHPRHGDQTRTRKSRRSFVSSACRRLQVVGLSRQEMRTG